MMTTEEGRAWAAGVYEATGSATVNNGRPRLSLKQVIDEDSPEPPEIVARFYRAVGGIGRIGGPYAQNPRTHPRRRRFAMGYAEGAEAAAVMSQLWPWLGDAKRRQWQEVAG